MILDILTDAYIYESDSDTVIPYIDLVNKPVINDRNFRLNFDFNINISSVVVNLATISGVTASGFYSEINDLGYPCAHYSFSNLDNINPNYLSLDFENNGCTQTSGVVCSGIFCDSISYLESEPYLLFSCSYTLLLYFKQSSHVAGTTQDNLFFSANRLDEVLNIGITQDNNLSLGLFNGSEIEIFDTGMPVVSGTWNLLSIRCQPKTKLRIGCNDSMTEVNRSCSFLGGSTIIYLGGKSGIGYFNGVLSDLTWWPNYADNIFIENALSCPEIALNGQRRSVDTTITSSGIFFDLSKWYPSQIYIDLNFPVENMITSININTYDDNFVLASGVDTLFCGTIVRGYTPTNFPIEIYNNTDYQSYAYLFPYDSNRYKALSISNDGINYQSNQISLPQDISWDVGEFESGINNGILLDIPHRTKIESNNKIILYDNSRQCLWQLSKDVFGFYDLRTKLFFSRDYPSFVSEAVGIYNTKNYWDFSTDNNYICFIHYKHGAYKYNIISNTWDLLHTIPECDNVCISTSTNYIFYSYYYSSKSEVFRYDISSGEELSVCSFNVSSLKIESNEDVLFVFNGSTMFKYDSNTLNIISVSQNIGLSNVLEIKDICGYVSIVTTSAVYSLNYFQEGWGVLSRVYSFSSSFSISTVNNCIQSIAFVTSSDEVYLTRLSHYRYRGVDVNTHINYNNTLSLLPVSQTERYDIVWAWLDTEESMPDFYLASKFSMSESTIYGFSRDTTPSEGTMSVFMFFNFITKRYVTLDSIVPNSLIDVENGCLVETYDKVYYINFNKNHYYKYIISTDTWSSILPPKTYDCVSNCTVVSAVYDLNDRVYVAGVSLGGYIGSQYYEDCVDRYYSFFGYIDIDTDIIHSLYYLPYSDAVGGNAGCNPISPGGTSFSCELNYNTVYSYLFLVVSQYTSKALTYTFNTSITASSGTYVFDSLEDLYDYGCIIYNPFTESKFNNLMNNDYFYTYYYTNIVDSDITERDAIYFTTVHSSYNFRWLGGSVGLKTNYGFSVHARVQIPDHSAYMPIILDSPHGGTEGFEVGFDDTDIIACCRKGTTSLTLTYPMSSAGVSKNDWIDLGASLSCDGGTSINLYVNGQNITSSGIGTTCYEYSSSAILHFMYTTGSPYMNTTNFYNNSSRGKLTEFSAFNRILSDTEFSNISYNNNSNKLLARILMDYNVINASRLPQSVYMKGQWDYCDGITRVYSIYDYTSDYIYYLSDYTFIKFNVLTSSTEWENLRKDYNDDCYYDFGVATIKSCFYATAVDTVAAQSEYGIVYIGSDVFDDFTKYYESGSFVSPIIDIGEIGLVAYNFEYSYIRDSYLEFYVRYANDKPVDFCHIYYIDFADTFRESSLATGKIFHTSAVSMSKSCAVYYDDTTIRVTIDGYVYENSNYVTPVSVFGLVGYGLSNITSTWFSYNGVYILYHTSDNYLVGFPLSLGIPCMRSSVTYTSANSVFWSKYAQRISVSADDGVYVYDYMLGEEDYVAGAYRIFYICEGPIVIKSTDNSVLLNKSGVYYTYFVDDIDFNKKVEFDYVTEWIYYVALSGNLKRMRYIKSEVGYELEFLDTGIVNVSDIYKVTFEYIILIINAKFVIYNKAGFVAVSDYPFLNNNSGDVIFFDYNPSNKVVYYGPDYLTDNDLIWSDLLYWTPLGSKSSGFIVGKQYIQLKVVFNASLDKTATPILRRMYFGSPVRVGPLLPHSAENFFVKLDVPLDDQGDIYSVKIITMAEDIVR